MSSERGCNTDDQYLRLFKVDLLLCCGDFQALRNTDDYRAFACPRKYQELGTFYK